MVLRDWLESNRITYNLYSWEWGGKLFPNPGRGESIPDFRNLIYKLASRCCNTVQLLTLDSLTRIIYMQAQVSL